MRTTERLRASVADAETASLLHTVKGAPILQIRRIALSYNDVPIELRVSQVNTARHEYWNELGRN